MKLSIMVIAMALFVGCLLQSFQIILYFPGLGDKDWQTDSKDND